MAVADQIFEQFLLLSEEEQRRLATRIFRKLDVALDQDAMTEDEWEAVWDEELARRERALDAGTAELVDGDVAMKQLFALAAARS